MERIEAFEKMLSDLKTQAENETEQMEKLKAAALNCYFMLVLL